mgnify:CR=1 FL=1
MHCVFLGAKSGYCDPLASALPIVFVRPVITLEQFFVKNSSKEKKEQTDENPLQRSNRKVSLSFGFDFRPEQSKSNFQEDT